MSRFVIRFENIWRTPLGDRIELVVGVVQGVMEGKDQLMVEWYLEARIQLIENIIRMIIHLA